MTLKKNIYIATLKNNKPDLYINIIASCCEKYGVENEKDYDISINAIYEITKRNTGEYAIRPFLVKYPQKTLTIMKQWSKDKNVHVRRLASEGVRPRLPWHNKLDQYIKNPKSILPILQNLKSGNGKS